MAFYVSTHSRPKAAGFIYLFDNRALRRFNTQPPEGGWKLLIDTPQILLRFQHTAARRRLATQFAHLICECLVSTHSRPKAAG